MPDVPALEPTCPNCGALMRACPMTEECIEVQRIMDQAERDLTNVHRSDYVDGMFSNLEAYAIPFGDAP